MEANRNYYHSNLIGNNSTCYTFYHNPRAGDTFKRRDPSATMGEPPTLFVPEAKLNGREVSIQRPNTSPAEMELILKAEEISSKLFAPCPSTSHSVCFRSSRNCCIFFALQCIEEMGSLKQDALRQKLNEIPTSEERLRYIRNNFNDSPAFTVKEWFYNPEKHFIEKRDLRNRGFKHRDLLEGEELADEIAYKDGDADTREMLLFKTMEKLKKSEEFTYLANKKEPEITEPPTNNNTNKKEPEITEPPTNNNKNFFEKVKERLGNLFFK